jgi:hypothetical protein
MMTLFVSSTTGTENSAFDILLAVRICGREAPETTNEVLFDGHSPCSACKIL